jgi:hypothetical protein
MVFDLRLKENFKKILAGPSGCGKTTFLVDLIKNISQFTIKPPLQIVYFYKEWQPKFDFLGKEYNVMFLLDNENIIDQVKQLKSPSFVIFDDMLNSSNLKAVAELYTVHGRHLNLSLAFLSQKLFLNNDYFRQISQNSDYICVFKNPCNSSEIRSLAMQITPQTLDLLDIYKKATILPFSYLLINLTQECIPQLKYLSNIFNETHITSVFVLSNCK